MLDELKEASSFFIAVDDLLEPLTRELIQARGLGHQHLDATMEDVRRSGFGAPLPGL
jgi:hypothetical protein